MLDSGTTMCEGEGKAARGLDGVRIDDDEDETGIPGEFLKYSVDDFNDVSRDTPFRARRVIYRPSPAVLPRRRPIRLHIPIPLPSSRTRPGSSAPSFLPRWPPPSPPPRLAPPPPPPKPTTRQSRPPAPPPGPTPPRARAKPPSHAAPDLTHHLVERRASPKMCDDVVTRGPSTGDRARAAPSAAAPAARVGARTRRRIREARPSRSRGCRNL